MDKAASVRMLCNKTRLTVAMACKAGVTASSRISHFAKSILHGNMCDGFLYKAENGSRAEDIVAVKVL